MNNNHKPLIFCALDTPDKARALELAAAMEDVGCGIKLGLEYFNANGPQGVEEIRNKYPDLPLFLDLKFHDIPNTVAGAVKAVTRLGPAYLNVHAAGGLAMMKAAKDAAEQEAAKLNIAVPALLAVTILTSLDESALAETGFQPGTENRVLQLAALTKQTGLAGIVCSAFETGPVRQNCGSDFILMVPGIRPAGSVRGDQKRVMTPAQAIEAGATHLVIGRPITGSTDPGAAATAILAEIEKQEQPQQPSRQQAS